MSLTDNGGTAEAHLEEGTLLGFERKSKEPIVSEGE